MPSLCTILLHLLPTDLLPVIFISIDLSFCCTPPYHLLTWLPSDLLWGRLMTFVLDYCLQFPTIYLCLLLLNMLPSPLFMYDIHW